MEVMHERCAALDISKRDVKVCVRIPNPRRRGTRAQEVRTFPTMTNALLELRDWLATEQVSVVSMEATGDYWKPVYYLLEGAGFDLMLVNARDAKGLPGRKTDVSDAVWLCQLTECGLLRASLVPPDPIRRLRDLTRYRTRHRHRARLASHPVQGKELSGGVSPQPDAQGGAGLPSNAGPGTRLLMADRGHPSEGTEDRAAAPAGG